MLSASPVVNHKVNKNRIAVPENCRIEVDLGNVGFNDEGETVALETRLASLSDPGTFFIGIDREPLTISLDDYCPGLGIFDTGFRQIQATFPDGLSRLPDNSVDQINSRMALGYYTAEGKDIPASYTFHGARVRLTQEALDRMPGVRAHTEEAAQVAYQKLKTAGCLSIIVCEIAFKILGSALENTPFEKIHVRQTKEQIMDSY